MQLPPMPFAVTTGPVLVQPCIPLGPGKTSGAFTIGDFLVRQVGYTAGYQEHWHDRGQVFTFSKANSISNFAIGKLKLLPGNELLRLRR